MNPHTITLNSETRQLIETALAVAGKVEITKENSTMEIPIKGKLILHFADVAENQVIELDLAE